MPKSTYHYLPQALAEQARARYRATAVPAGPGDGFIYTWERREPAIDYCGPLPTGRLMRRRREQ